MLKKTKSPSMHMMENRKIVYEGFMKGLNDPNIIPLEVKLKWTSKIKEVFCKPKYFTFRKKKYKWTPKIWQLILGMLIVIFGSYMFIVLMFMLQEIIHG